jgi:predicted regulator of Ras-like GTPase activity (Roadblock/LC7/MglB family)
MAETKKEKLDQVLTKFMEVGQISAAGIVSAEGLLIILPISSALQVRNGLICC